MFRSLCIAFGAAVATAAVAGAAIAQDADRVADGAIRPVAAGASAEVIKLSTVMKSKVLIQEDEPAGQVVDFVLSDAGCLDYVVASYDDQYYAIPYSAVSLRSSDRAIFVDISPAQFRKVTFFAANQWPDFYARSFQQNVFATFDVDVIRHDHRTAKPDLDRADDRRDRRDDARDNARDRTDARENRSDARENRTDARENRTENRGDLKNRNDGTAGEKGADTPRDRVQDRDRNPNERRDPKDRDPKDSDKDKASKDNPKPDLGGLTPKAGDSKPQPKSEKPKADLPKAEKPKADAPKPIAPSPSSPKPKDK